MELCLECKEDCSWGSGRFINRYPRITMNDKDEYVDEGYVCGWCSSEIDKIIEEENK
tara:strand:- start:52 stop:222 length:171 start_codon:yes stop_codon:yes gene_type:complete